MTRCGPDGARHVNAPQIKLQRTRDGFNVPVAAVEVHVSRLRRV